MIVLRAVFIVFILMLPAQADELSDLFGALKSAKTESEARVIEKSIWQVWLRGPTQQSTDLVAEAMRRRQSYDYAGALEILNKAVTLAPDWAEALNQRAFIRFLREEYDESLADIDRVLELEPRHFGALAGKAHILLRQGRAALGQKALQHAVKINPFLRERALLITPPGREL